MRKILFILALLFSTQAYSQRTVKAYADLRSYLDNNYTTVQRVYISPRTEGDIRWKGGNDYEVTSNNEGVTKTLKKRCWAVEYNDTLMLNMRMMRNRGYAIALCRTSRYIFFRARAGNVKGATKDGSIVFLGVAGGMMHATESAMARFDYLLDLQTGTFIVLTDDGGGLKDVLASNKALQMRYINAGMPCDNASYISYLKELDKEN